MSEREVHLLSHRCVCIQEGKSQPDDGVVVKQRQNTVSSVSCLDCESFHFQSPRGLAIPGEEQTSPSLSRPLPETEETPVVLGRKRNEPLTQFLIPGNLAAKGRRQEQLLWLELRHFWIIGRAFNVSVASPNPNPEFRLPSN